MTEEFPLRCILQPALLLAHVSVYALPLTFARLPEELAGVLVGAGLITTSVYRFKVISELKRELKKGGLGEPLLGQPKPKEYTASTTVLALVASLLIVKLVGIEGEIGGAAVLAICVLSGPLTRDGFVSIVCGASLAGVLTYIDAWPGVEGYLAAITAGFMLQVAAFDCLSLWDHVHQSPLGFNLSALALVTLFVAATSLEIVS